LFENKNLGFKCLMVLTLIVMAWLMQGCSSNVHASARQWIVYGVSKNKNNTASAVERARLAAELNADQLMLLINGIDLSVVRSVDGGITCTANTQVTLRGVFHEPVEIRKDYSVVKIVLDRQLLASKKYDDSEKAVLLVKGEAEQSFANALRAIEKHLMQHGYKRERIHAKVENIQFDLDATPPSFTADLNLHAPGAFLNQ
jgi:hypothetical protein